MRAASLSQGSRAQKTFLSVLALLGAVAIAQLLLALGLYWQRARETRRTEQLTAGQSASIAVSRSIAPSVASSTVAAPVTDAGRASARGAEKTRLLPAPVSIPDELLQVAKALRQQGDTGNAIAKLQQAAALAPRNAEILAELALTYESMQLFDRSNEAWRRLQSLGAGAGPLAELADLKLRVGAPVRGIPGSTGEATAAGAPNSVTDIPDGSAFGISQVTPTMLNDPKAQTKLTLRVGVKVRRGTAIDHTKVKIQVFFYDVVDNDQVVLTDADVSYEWVTPGHNWLDSDTEVLDVTYLRSKKNYPAPGTALEEVPDSVEKATREAKAKAEEPPPPAETENRQYLGYIVRVYYKEELQAVRAAPTRLLNLFPPPFTAPPQ
jgi:tetratricopeptide (TPR) repeat protein